jgi:hypothetical protein
MAARRRQANQATLIRHVTRYSLATNQMLQQLQQAFIAAHASTVDALHQAQAELYAIVQMQAACCLISTRFGWSTRCWSRRSSWGRS